MSTALSSPVQAAPTLSRPASAPLAISEALISSRALLGSASTLIIEHMGMHYTLRATRNGKLILTK